MILNLSSQWVERAPFRSVTKLPKVSLEINLTKIMQLFKEKNYNFRLLIISFLSTIQPVSGFKGAAKIDAKRYVKRS